MPVTLQYVSLHDIATDPSPFVITYRPDTRLLERSVARQGIVTPVHLRHQGTAEPLQLLCGSQRLQAARSCNLSTVPALVYPYAELTDEQAFLLALHDNLGCRTLNVVEKARALQRLRDDFAYSIATLATDICPLLALPPRPETVLAYCSLAALNETLQAALAEGMLSVETALWIRDQASTDQESLTTLFTSLKLSSSRAREFVAMLDDLQRRDAQSVQALLRAYGILEVLLDTHLAGPQKIERIRHMLRQARYPQLHTYEQRFHAALRQLKLPPQLRLQAPAFFEGDQYQVTFAFRERQECQQSIERLLEAIHSPAFADLLDLL